ncbi:hypothetical protein BH09BAC1_BH09BAC1_20510 [soil metagenome]
MKCIFLSLVLIVLAVNAEAGTYPYYYYLTQHTQNQLLYNPAYAGSTDKLNLHLHSMHGLYKVTGTRASTNPLNIGYLAFDRPCPTIKGAWGAYALFDVPQTPGRYYRLSVGGNYAYRWQINDDHRLQFGAGINYRRYYSDLFSSIVPNDPLLVGRASGNHLDFSLGVWYQYKGLNTGISLTHFGNFHFGGIGNNYLGRYTPVFNVYASYALNLTDDFNFEPYLYFATADKNLGSGNLNEKAQFSAGFMGDYSKALFIGLGYSSDRIISPSIGFQLKKKIRFQGTYNYLLNQQSDYLRYHNFEISITVQLPHNKR